MTLAQFINGNQQLQIIGVILANAPVTGFNVSFENFLTANSNYAIVVFAWVGNILLSQVYHHSSAFYIGPRPLICLPGTYTISLVMIHCELCPQATYGVSCAALKPKETAVISLIFIITCFFFDSSTRRTVRRARKILAHWVLARNLWRTVLSTGPM